MRILGLDPGTATTGYGVVDFVDGYMTPIVYGVISTKAHTPMQLRLQTIYQDLTELIEEYKPDAAGIEEVFFGRNIEPFDLDDMGLGI